MSDTKLKATVRRAYGKIALDAAAPCCGVGNGPDEVSARIGYSQDELAAVPPCLAWWRAGLWARSSIP